MDCRADTWRGYKVEDANGQAPAYVYARETPADAAIANVLTMDEARRIANNITRCCRDDCRSESSPGVPAHCLGDDDAGA